MPFITYSIKSELLDNPEKLNVKNFRKFLNDLEELNISNKSILIENEKLNILNKITKKISELSESLISNKTVKIDYDFYLGRVDRLYLTKAGIFELKKGEPSEFPKAPLPNNEAFLLCLI